MLDQILQNQSDKIEVDIYYNGSLVNPTSIKIKQLINPNGTVLGTELVVTQGSTTGRYYYTVPASYTTILGVYVADWEFIINGITYKHSQQFEVVSSIRSGYIVPQELRDGSLLDLNVTDYPNATLQKYIDKSTSMIDAYLGDSINYSNYIENIRCVIDKVHNGLHIQLKHKPIISLTSVVITTTPSNTINLDVDEIRINNNAGYLEYLYDATIPNYTICITDWASSDIIPVATVNYTAGYSTVPDQVKKAAITLCEQLIREFKDNDKSLSGFTIGKYTERYTDSKGKKGRGEIGSDEVLQLLKKYRQPNQNIGLCGPLG